VSEEDDTAFDGFVTTRQATVDRIAALCLFKKDRRLVVAEEISEESRSFMVASIGWNPLLVATLLRLVIGKASADEANSAHKIVMPADCNLKTDGLGRFMVPLVRYLACVPGFVVVDSSVVTGVERERTRRGNRMKPNEKSTSVTGEGQTNLQDRQFEVPSPTQDY
jgi:hypothetical protein